METEPLHSIGTQKQILFDDHLVEDKRGFALTMNPALRTEDPVIVPDKPWEAKGTTHSSVVTGVKDVHELWYYAPDLDGNGHCMCYATSSDGITWEKPDLGLFEFGGNKNNNIVTRGLLATMFADPTADPEQRYKFIGDDGSGWGVTSVNCGGARFRYFTGELETWEYHSVIGAHSPDGINWTKYDKPIMPWYTDTHNVAFWDDQRERYVAFLRMNEHLHIDETGRQVGSFDYRTIARTESEDFTNFRAPEKILEPDFSLTEDEDLSGGGLYNSAAIKYPFAPDAYLIFTSAYHHTGDTLDVQLAVSRDGIHFDRWLEPFLRLGVNGRFDSQSLYMNPGFVESGDELFFYYSGHSGRHDLDLDQRKPPCLGRVRVRMDGFISQDADVEESSLTTVPFTLEGDRLQLNMDASSRGWLKVEILDATGHAIWGYSKVEADRMMFNDIAQTVTWNGEADLSSLRGRAVRLRFIGQSAKLFAFQFVSG